MSESKLPPMVGTLSTLPEHVQKVVKSYALAAIAINRTTPPPAPVLSDAWQPIETAPKNECILIWQPKFSTVTLSINDGFEYKHATHWQPLPPPPIEQAIGRASRGRNERP